MGTKKRTTRHARDSATAPKQARAPKGPPPPTPPGGVVAGDGSGGGELDASLQTETRRRYLNYALSVITSRALPDVRDGLKPVQRRILYAMWHDEHLYPDAKHRKSAKVVGAVIGRYHPHGDSAVYDAMVRMAQDFSLRVPLVDGSGNFGSLDGDSAAAYRYTEARLAPPAMELLRELRQDTVAFRPNYDGTTEEPVVLPARFPNLLVNGSTGIAVGLATNIPPHNLGEVTRALVALIEDRELKPGALLRYIKAPDFPTGGMILNTKAELRQIYETGQGAVRLRGEYKTESKGRGVEQIVVTSIPYAITKATIVERIADVIIRRKLPQLVDVRDESTTDVRIVLEIKKDADPAVVMAYLFKNTPLQMNFNVNLTCLVPTPHHDVGQPRRMSLKELLEEFLDFRFHVTRRRFEHELAALLRRIHILEGFITIFDALDETIRIIRRSDGKKDAAQKLMKRFDLDDVQVDAILELRLYKLAKLEILVLREELADKQKLARQIEVILASDKKLWGVVKDELEEVARAYGDKRRTVTGGAAEELEFDEEAYIVDEDAHVVVTRDGWIKRLREVKDPQATRVREGDAVAWVLAGSTKECVAFFTNYGSAYVTRIHDVPPTTGYGQPIQKLFKFKDGERIVSAMSLDPRAVVPETLLAVSARGFGQRFAIETYLQPTTRSGRKYAKPPKGDELVGVTGAADDSVVVVATRNGHVLRCKAGEVSKLENPGKGVTVIKTAEGDRVIGFIAGDHRSHILAVETEKGGRTFELRADPKQVASRGGKGQQIVKRARLMLTPRSPEVTVLATSGGGEEIH
jgi:DNA gyrase subunit A